MSDTQGAAPGNGGRQWMMLAFAAVIVLAAAGYGLYWLMHGHFYEETDNAYVGGNVVQITPLVGGVVISVNTDDTRPVKAGQVLAQLDPTDARVALSQAVGELAQTVRQVRTIYGNNDQYAAALAARQTDLARSRDDLRRREQAGGAVSREELDHARAAVQAAEANVAAAWTQLNSNRTLAGQSDVANHPNVVQAAARLRGAYLSLVRTAILAPVDGYVAQRSVQIGQRVGPGSVLMAVVPLDQVWVEANFTEVHLERVRLGQPVELTADLYGSGVVYHGSVAGFSPGTGGAFALLPAQNATGNWIKVVQRLPVRIALNPKELAEHPLRIGLSMQATIDLHNQSGKQVSAVSAAPAYKTDVYARQAAEADAIVAKIIAENER
ncbi:MAG: HlyD family efflux transporter periplasmic adaptor subunit [Nevskia sp.]|nr:HlyD family efflux transporter periplasmic adaptor subunit [Nevskia sp.]